MQILSDVIIAKKTWALMKGSFKIWEMGSLKSRDLIKKAHSSNSLNFNAFISKALGYERYPNKKTKSHHEK